MRSKKLAIGSLVYCWFIVGWFSWFFADFVVFSVLVVVFRGLWVWLVEWCSMSVSNIRERMVITSQAWSVWYCKSWGILQYWCLQQLMACHNPRNSRTILPYSNTDARSLHSDFLTHWPTAEAAELSHDNKIVAVHEAPASEHCCLVGPDCQTAISVDLNMGSLSLSASPHQDSKWCFRKKSAADRGSQQLGLIPHHLQHVDCTLSTRKKGGQRRLSSNDLMEHSYHPRTSSVCRMVFTCFYYEQWWSLPVCHGFHQMVPLFSSSFPPPPLRPRWKVAQSLGIDKFRSK